jgi:hypothetical protein
MTTPLSHMNTAGKKILNTIDEEKRFFASWWIWLAFILTITAVGFTGLRYAGIIAQTKLERVVFTNSQQYVQGRNTEQLTYRAELAKINEQLKREDLSPSAISNLKSSRAALEVQLNVATNL